jgi:preprotein translocase subunit SecF
MKIFARVPNINFMAQRKVGLWISAMLTVIALSLVAFHGLNFGIDFTGGVLVEVSYPERVELDKVRAELAEAGYHNATVQQFGSASSLLIRLPPVKDDNASLISGHVLEALHAKEKGIELRRVEFVGPQIGEELFSDGGLAALFAFIGIAIYIMFRFEWKFSVGAVTAVVHDVIMVLGFLALFDVEFDITTLAAILALMGYSNNETIVIFDRVRENLLSERRMEVIDIVNLSVNQTLLRSIITHVSTSLVLIALLALGGATVHSFSISLLVGVIVATYSSIYISTNLAVALGLSREDLVPPEEKEVDEVL